jgi:hypothetical protein
MASSQQTTALAGRNKWSIYQISTTFRQCHPNAVVTGVSHRPSMNIIANNCLLNGMTFMYLDGSLISTSILQYTTPSHLSRPPHRFFSLHVSFSPRSTRPFRSNRRSTEFFPVHLCAGVYIPHQHEWRSPLSLYQPRGCFSFLIRHWGAVNTLLYDPFHLKQSENALQT